MQFLIRAYDGEGKLDKRMEVRPRHLEGMKRLSIITGLDVIFQEDMTPMAYLSWWEVCRRGIQQRKR